MVQRLLRSLIVLGSRLSIVSIVSLSVFVAESCRNSGACAFEDEDLCGDGGAGGGAWAPGGSGVYCGPEGQEVECPADACRMNIRCTENGECTGDRVDGWEDFNACTVDACDPETGESTHTPIPPSEMDDGDDCTEDYCWATEGVVHQNICEGA